jgi:hypothetical protein
MGLDLDYINGQMDLDEVEKDGLLMSPHCSQVIQPFKTSIIRKKFTQK